jgi:hypothetical protein
MECRVEVVGYAGYGVIVHTPAQVQFTTVATEAN